MRMHLTLLLLEQILTAVRMAAAEKSDIEQAEQVSDVGRKKKQYYMSTFLPLSLSPIQNIWKFTCQWIYFLSLT